MAFMRVCRSFHEDVCMLSFLCYNTHKIRCVQAHHKGSSSSNPSALSRRMWGSFNTSNRNYTALQVSQDGDGFILLHTFPWWNLPTSRHKPIKADENAVIYQVIMLPPARVCVSEEKERTILLRQTLDICWIRQYIQNVWPKKREINHFYLFSFQSLIMPVYQPVPVRRDAVSLFNRSISLPFPCHANKKRGLCRIRAGKRTLLPCKRDWRHFSAPQREGWTAESTWAGGGQIH